MQSSRIVQTFLFFFFVTLVSCTSPSDFLSQTDSQKFENILLSFKKDDSFGTVQETYQALFSLKELGAKIGKEDTQAFCDSVHKILAVESNVRTVFHALRINTLLECSKHSRLTSEQAKAVQKSLEGTLEDVFYGASIILENKLDNQIDLSEVIDGLVGLELENGMFVEPEVEPSFYVTGLTLQLLAKLYKFHNDLSLDDKDSIESLELQDILVMGTEKDDALVFMEHSVTSPGNIPATAAIFSGVNALSLATSRAGYGLQQAQVVQLTEYFVSHKYVTSVQDIYYVMLGLRTSVKSSLGVPVVVTLVSEVVSTSGKDATVTVRVTDPLGKPLPKMKVTLNSATLVTSPATSIVNGQEFKPVSSSDSNTDYSLNFFLTRPEHGFYELDISVKPGAARYLPVDSASRMLKLVSSVTPVECSLKVLDSEESEYSSNTAIPCAEFGQTISDVVSANYYQRIELSFKLKSQSKAVTSHQAFVHLKNKADPSQDVTLIARNTDKKYTVKMNLAKIADDRSLQTGEYSLDLIVGDSLFTNSFSWTIANIELTTVVNSESSSRSLLSAKPEIHHQFRVPEKRPPAALSLTFTGFALVPLLLFILGVQFFKANLSNFPSNDNALPVVFFHVCIASFIMLFVLFWFKINMINTLIYSGFLTIPTLLCGSKALSHLNSLKGKSD